MIRISFKSATSIFLALIMILALSVSCSQNTAGGIDDGSKGSVLDRKPLENPPSYGHFASSLEYYEKQLGLKFFKNKNKRYMPYATAGPMSFSIADDLNECLYDINMKSIVTYRSVRGRTRSMIEMDITRGPCGIKYPDADPTAQDRVTLMEGSVLSPAIDEQVNGGISLVRGATFLQKILNLPWRVDSVEGGLEQAVSTVGKIIKNPLDVTFGDVVFFTEYYGERNVGIYYDYGYIVYNSCFRAQVIKMDSSMNYQIYRVFTGPAAIHYKIHETKFLKELIGSPGE